MTNFEKYKDDLMKIAEEFGFNKNTEKIGKNELKLIKDISEVTNKEYKYVHRSGNHVLLFCDKPPIDKYGILLDETDYIDISGHMHLFSNIEFMNGLYDIKDECFIEI